MTRFRLSPLWLAAMFLSHRWHPTYHFCHGTRRGAAHEVRLHEFYRPPRSCQARSARSERESSFRLRFAILDG